MRLSISKMAKESGVSVRTLHYYDKIGLLRPSEVVAENGYRYYDETDMRRLQQILVYRELEFSLKEIEELMKNSKMNQDEVFRKQRELLKLKRKRLDQIIGLLDDKLKGEENMSCKAFDTKEYDHAKEEYTKEIESRWGDTEAYAENKKKTAGYQKGDWDKVYAGMDVLIEQFSAHLGEDPSNPEIQKLVGEWQQYITDHFYTCTKEILKGLGQMYIADERFCKNMNKFGEGTAKLISEAIQIYE